MDILHILFSIVYLTLAILCVTLKAKKKLFALVPMVIITAICSLDYAITQFRGLGFVVSDFGPQSTLLHMLKYISFPVGKRYFLCLAWILLVIVIALLSEKLSVRFRIITIAVSGIILCVITDYPTNTELFRGNITYPIYRSDKGDEWYERDAVICHALGGVADGDTLTNSYNALELNYAKGFRTFETDIVFTSDGIPVLRHDWESDFGQADDFGWTEGETWAPTEEEFKNALIYDKYIPMTLGDLFRFMQKHKDMYIVFDTKLTEEMSVTDQYTIIRDYAISEGFEEVLDRVVVQLYFYDMYDTVNEVYPFKNYLLTLYVMGWRDGDEIPKYLSEKQIKVLTVPSYSDIAEISSTLEGTGVYLYTHTIDSPGEAKVCIENGVYGIYTDWYSPYMYEEMKKEYLVGDK